MDYKARFYDSYITHHTQPDSIIPDPTNPQAWNRYAYALNNPVRYKDPSGHYVCTGYNEGWGDQTCYDIVDAFLDFLYVNGGDEGEALVEAFMQADEDYTIRISFEDDLGGAYGQTNPRLRTIAVLDTMGTGTDDDEVGLAASYFGHEVYHLTEQEGYEQGTASSELEAYNYQAKLLDNMGIAMPDGTYLEYIHEHDSLSATAEILNLPKRMTLRHHLERVVLPIARFLVGAEEATMGCYGTVCFVPGGYPYQYSLPEEE